eukprot:4869646-Prymnesium_polylepis.1
MCIRDRCRLQHKFSIRPGTRVASLSVLSSRHNNFVRRDHTRTSILDMISIFDCRTDTRVEAYAHWCTGWHCAPVVPRREDWTAGEGADVHGFQRLVVSAVAAGVWPRSARIGIAWHESRRQPRARGGRVDSSDHAAQQQQQVPPRRLH